MSAATAAASGRMAAMLARGLLDSGRGRAVAVALALLVVGVLAGLVALWPAAEAPRFSAPTPVGAEQAQVVGVEALPCPLSASGRPCQRLDVELRSGPDEGARVPLTLPGVDVAPEVSPGDAIRVVANDAGAGAQGALPEGVEPYAFADFERRLPILALALVFAALVVGFGRWKGVRSLLGLAVSLAVVTQFMVPAILEGSSPLAVALVGSLAVMLLTIGLTHGAGAKSIAAVLGAAASLLAIALLAVFVIGVANITGFSSEESQLLRGGSTSTATLSLSGLVLAGLVIAALGVLDDVTISQSSTVMALQRANPAQGFGALFRGALSVGRDHLSATVNTLVFAYVGASLPLLLIFETQGTAFGDALNGESVAGEVVAMLVGSIGLILAVPLTTALAAMLARQLPASALPEEHGHHH